MANKALLCGINNYQTQSALRGCINDVKNMSELLTRYFDFASENIRQLTDEQVTKRAIMNEYQWLLDGAKSGDNLVFQFSGHGSYIPDEQGDEVDGADEILCLYDIDFYNPETYICDDEWNALMAEVAADAQLTLIFDSCHSGTGTRAITITLNGQKETLWVDVATTEKRGISSPFESRRSLQELKSLEPEEYQDLLQSRSVILPRFLAPPVAMQERIIATARTRGLRTQAPPLEKHLFLAGCQDDQTSADAYIDGDFHGAFTYYLCQALREKPDLGSQTIIKTVTQRLTDNGFSQTPQHEGAARSSYVFGQPPTSFPPHISQPEADMTNTLPTQITPENQKLLIEAYMKLLDTLGGSLAETRAIAARPRLPNRYLVYVHGISTHQAGYSDSWWNSLQPFVGSVFGGGTLGDTRQEVIWSDLVNPKTRSATDNAESDRLRREIELILEERQKMMIAEQTGTGAALQRTAHSTLERGRDFAIDDFLVYMLDPKMRQRIIDRFTAIVRPLLTQGGQVDIISHSWGTVVSYEGLRELEDLSLAGRVNNFFTVGSALSIGPVYSSLRPKNKDGDLPAGVTRWINLDAKGDLVGGLLRDKFAVTQENLNLEPTGCSSFLGIVNLGCAHSSYFDRRNVEVNRNIFARWLNS